MAGSMGEPSARVAGEVLGAAEDDGDSLFIRLRFFQEIVIPAGEFPTQHAGLLVTRAF